MKRIVKSGVNTTTGLGLNSFSKDELDAIHYATLQILQNTGIKVTHKKALEIFHGSGASIEPFDNYGIVKLPSYLVEECICSVPHTFIYHGRNPENDFLTEPNRVGFTTFGGCINVIDPSTQQVRRATKQDCGNLAKVCDYLDEIDVVARSVNATDVPGGAQSVNNLEVLLTHTGKHIFLGVDSARALRVMVEMASVCTGGRDAFKKRPIFTATVCPTSPLVLTDDICEVMMEACKLGVGMLILPMSLSGATSSASLAGTLVTHNAEVLSAIVFAQIMAKGIPCTYGSTSTILDLRFGTSAIGSPEFGMINAAIAKIAQYYRLPSWVGGGASDSKLPDAQSGYEFTLSATLSGLAGGNIIFGSGVLEQGMTMDFAKLIMDAEMIKMVKTAISGIKISDETLSMDIIHEVGPGGAYISHEQSLNLMRSQSQSKLFDRRSRIRWEENNADRPIEARAYELADHILKNHKPYPLKEGVSEEMRRMVEVFEAELKKGE